MSITVKCPACGLRTEVRDRNAGRVVACPGCEAKIKVPATQDAYPEEAADDRKKCPECGKLIRGAARRCRFCDADLTGEADGSEGSEDRVDRVKCRACAEWIKRDAKKCRFCGEKVPGKMSSAAALGRTLLQTFGLLVFLVGVGLLIGFLNMDTSVAVGGGERVHNIGLMENRRVGLVGSLIAAVVGAGLIISGSRKS
jgi:hypothetical protein